MNVKKTELQDALIIEPPVFEDKRGYFSETHNHKKFTKKVGQFDIVQINRSKSKYGVLRGLHYQRPPFTQAKLVEVVKGMIIDVIVDIRTDSPTFGQHQTFVLDDQGKHQLYVPRGFAHGFVVLTSHAVFQYLVDNEYAPDYDTGIKFDDPTLNIDWEVQNPKVSDKDMGLDLFSKQVFFPKAEYLRQNL